jgi:hypothetical protein
MQAKNPRRREGNRSQEVMGPGGEAVIDFELSLR